MRNNNKTALGGKYTKHRDVVTRFVFRLAIKMFVGRIRGTGRTLLVSRNFDAVVAYRPRVAFSGTYLIWKLDPTSFDHDLFSLIVAPGKSPVFPSQLLISKMAENQKYPTSRDRERSCRYNARERYDFPGAAERA